ncbi:hypothetical protein QBC43DRAFT_317312 [Cladorrhinum sp. PSN259]|nr:hypothetical protein QBC43DRAFT_317312 [Cladorrhinum sp. PSN259]
MVYFPELPAEIIAEILDSICPECTNGGIHSHGDEPHPAKTFASLCVTSKHLKEFAVKRLYRRPDCRKWWLLGRTLVARRDLGELVRQLYLDEPELAWLDNSKRDGQELEELEEYYLERRDPAIYPPISQSSLWGRFNETLYDFGANAHIDVILSLCPNVELLHSTIWFFDAFGFCKPQSLQRLKHIKIIRADTEGSLDIGECKHLFLAAPNLEAMEFVDAGSVQGRNSSSSKVLLDRVKLDRVTQISFERSGLDAEGLRTILRWTPNVQRINYEHIDTQPGQFTPREALQVLGDEGMAKQLREFTFEIDEDVGQDLWGWGDEDELKALEREFKERGIRFKAPTVPVPHVNPAAVVWSGSIFGWLVTTTPAMGDVNNQGPDQVS